MPAVIPVRITVVIIHPTRQNAEIRGNQMNEAAISRAAESYYDNLQILKEREQEQTQRAAEDITAAFETQSPVPYVEFKHTPKLRYEPFNEAVMGLIDYEEVQQALMVLLASKSPEVKKFISVCAARHVSMWADEVGGVL